MSMEVTPYMAQGERYPSLIGVEADGDEHELAYVSKHELIKALEERDRLQSENAKLREYVLAVAIQSYKNMMWCNLCPFEDQCYNDEPKEHQGRGCQWWLWARELGIEVGE